MHRAVQGCVDGLLAVEAFDVFVGIGLLLSAGCWVSLG